MSMFLSEVDCSQGLPTLGQAPMVAPTTPGEAFPLLFSGTLSGLIAGWSVARKDGWKQGATVGLLVFFGVAALKMFYDIYKRP